MLEAASLTSVQNVNINSATKDKKLQTLAQNNKELSDWFVSLLKNMLEFEETTRFDIDNMQQTIK